MKKVLHKDKISTNLNDSLHTHTHTIPFPLTKHLQNLPAAVRVLCYFTVTYSECILALLVFTHMTQK